jgi:poly-beta-1,6-N-acetyl-D-glucosamine synthase
MTEIYNNVGVSVGIVAFNEAESIEYTLESVITACKELKIDSEIIVIASGCTDETVKIATGFKTNYSNLKIINESQRKGKASALNNIVKIAKGEIVVFCDADVILNPKTLHILYQAFVNDESLSLAFGKVNILKGPSSFWTKIGEKSAQALDSYRSLKNGRGLWMVCGHLYAIRAKNWKDIPEFIICDDVYIGLNVMHHKGKIIYLPEAIVQISYPQTLADYLSQKLRNRFGRRQLFDLTINKIPPPTRWIGLDLLHYNQASGVKHIPIILLDIITVFITEVGWLFKYRQSHLWGKINSSKLGKLNKEPSDENLP